MMNITRTVFRWLLVISFISMALERFALRFYPHRFEGESTLIIAPVACLCMLQFISWWEKDAQVPADGQEAGDE